MTLLFDTLAQALKGEVLRDEPLARHTSWKVGGPADLFLQPEDLEDLRQALRRLHEAHVPFVALGSGSNLLASDEGFRGAVIRLNHLNAMEFLPHSRVRAQAGLPLSVLIQSCAHQGLGGLEELAGIPATVGGATAMNAGAGTQSFGSRIEALHLLNSRGEARWQDPKDRFAYRHCRLEEGTLVAEVRLQLQPTDPMALKATMDACLSRRRDTQAVEGPNAGSVFKNPPGLQAWKLIDDAGLRGERIGQAQISRVHANFIVNLGGARAEEIRALVKRIQEKVHRSSGILLVPEVRTLHPEKGIITESQVHDPSGT